MKHGDTQLHTDGEGNPALPADSTAKIGAPAAAAPPRPGGAPRVTVTSEGMISDEEWSDDRGGGQSADERPLQDLAASLLAGSPVEDQTPDDDTLAPAVLVEEERVEAPGDSGEVPPAREEEARRPLAAFALLGASVLVVIAGAFWLIRAGSGELGTVTSVGAAGTPPRQNLVAAKPPPAAKPAPAVKATATPTPSQPAPQITAAPAPAPTPASTPAPAPPTAAPTAAPTPTPPPPVKPRPTIHISDLDAATPGQRVVVKIYVHDATHNPVAGVTVTGQWSGAYTGGASCVTDATGSCGIRSQNVSGSGSVTFTVAKLSLSGNDYAASANHDPDGGSNGTSITVPV